MSDRLEEQIKKLQDSIDYENSMYETAITYPTDTPQFYHALEQTRQRINDMYAELDKLKALNHRKDD
jgi:hypothetical protein